MQYESIILELMARIQNLEEEVNALKQITCSQESRILTADMNDTIEGTNINDTDATTSYQKMTDEMIMICYKCGKKLYAGENPTELAEDIAIETGMNRNSAIMYLYAVSGMLDGTIFKRAISAKALKKYFQLIFDEYGSAGLKKALNATKLHIDYRKECGHTVDAIEKIYNEYERRL